MLKDFKDYLKLKMINNNKFGKINAKTVLIYINHLG